MEEYKELETCLDFVVELSSRISVRLTLNEVENYKKKARFKTN